MTAPEHTPEQEMTEAFQKIADLRDEMITERVEKTYPPRSATCPCTVIEPCSSNCSCADGLMSGGCLRCATYGSAEQRVAASEWIASAIKAYSPTPSSDTPEMTELQTALDSTTRVVATTMCAVAWRIHRKAIESAFSKLETENQRLRRFETYVCQVIAMGNQADLTVESLPK